MQWRNHYWYGVPCQKARIEEIVRRAKGKILDIGCNEGFLSQALKEKELEVVSIDKDDKVIAKAKELFDIDAIKTDANILPFDDESFDLVIGGEILEHTINPGIVFSEMFRVSKGRVIISLPIGEYWLGCQDHKWQIEGMTVEHDQGLPQKIDKQFLILEFIKRR